MTEVLTRISAPALGSEYGANIKTTFENINNNFGVIGSKGFSEGPTGDGWEFDSVALSSLLEGDDNKYAAGIMSAISEIGREEDRNALLSQLKSSDLKITLGKKVTDSPDSEEPWENSYPIVFIDSRFTDLDTLKEDDPEAVDLSGMLVLNNVVFEEGAVTSTTWTFTQPFPTLYYKTVDEGGKQVGRFYWKINGNETDIPAQGPTGSAGKDGRFWLVRVAAGISIPVEGANIRLVAYMKADSRDGGWSLMTDFEGKNGDSCIVMQEDNINEYWISNIYKDDDEFYAWIGDANRIDATADFTEQKFFELMMNITPSASYTKSLFVRADSDDNTYVFGSDGDGVMKIGMAADDGLLRKEGDPYSDDLDNPLIVIGGRIATQYKNDDVSPVYMPEIGYNKPEGEGSIAVGYNTTASGDYSIAAGSYSESKGNNSVAIGDGATTEENAHNSIAVGTSVNTYGANSMAVGESACTYGENSISIGDDTKSYGEGSVAMGLNTHARGAHSHAEGEINIPSAAEYGWKDIEITITDVASAGSILYYDWEDSPDPLWDPANVPCKCLYYPETRETREIITDGVNSGRLRLIIDNPFSVNPSVGDTLIAYRLGAAGDVSHVEGRNCLSFGLGSHAEGQQTVAEGQFSHAEGFDTHAVYGYSHTEGYQTLTSGQYSHAEGHGTIADYIYSHAEGNYNAPGYAYTNPTPGTTGYNIYKTGSHATGYADPIIFSIGCGKGDEETGSNRRKNAFFVTTSGKVWVLDSEGSKTYGGQDADTYKCLNP